MPDAETHSPKVLAQTRNRVTQTVVTTVTTTLLDTHRSHRQVELVVNKQHALRRNTVIRSQRGDGLAAAVHESTGLEQVNIARAHTDLADITGELLIRTKHTLISRRQFVQKPETRIMAGFFVFRTRISQARNQVEADLTLAHGSASRAQMITQPRLQRRLLLHHSRVKHGWRELRRQRGRDLHRETARCCARLPAERSVTGG